jgi:hypothetical protein
MYELSMNLDSLRIVPYLHVIRSYPTVIHKQVCQLPVPPVCDTNWKLYSWNKPCQSTVFVSLSSNNNGFFFICAFRAFTTYVWK